MALCLAVAGFAIQVLLTAANPAKYQWDFLPYWSAARDALSGAGLSEFANLFPPYRPLLLLPLGLLPHGSAFAVFLLLKVVVTAAVLFLAAHLFGRQRGWQFLILFACLGFNAALGFDLRSGNVASIETGLLLLAFVALLRGQTVAYALLVLAAGSLKMVPCVFLLLLFLIRTRRARRILIAGSATAVAMFALPVLCLPRYTKGIAVLVENSAMLRGPIDQSLLALVKDLLALTSATSSPWPAAVAYAAGLLGILWPSIVVLRRLRHESTSSHQLAILFFTLVYGLTAPRMVTYSYSLLIVPVFALVAWVGWSRWTLALLSAAILPTDQVLRRVLARASDASPGPLIYLPLEYWNWLILFGVWVLVLQRLRTIGVRRRPLQGDAQ